MAPLCNHRGPTLGAASREIREKLIKLAIFDDFLRFLTKIFNFFLSVAAAEAAKQAAEAAKQAMEAAKAAREAEEQRRILAEERADELRKAELEKIKQEIEAEAEIRRQENEQRLKDEEMLEIMKKRAAEEAEEKVRAEERLRRELDESLNLVRQGGVGGDSSLPSENGLPDGDSVLEKKELGEGGVNEKKKERKPFPWLFRKKQK